jgi:hypothetical protein
MIFSIVLYGIESIEKIKGQPVVPDCPFKVKNSVVKDYFTRYFFPFLMTIPL